MHLAMMVKQGLLRNGLVALYDPYMDVLAQCKNKIPPLTSGDWSIHTNAVVNGDYSLTLNATASGQKSIIYIPAKASNLYTIQSIVSGSGGVIDVYFIGSNAIATYATSISPTINSRSFTTPDNCVQIQLQFSCANSGTFTFSNFQLEESSAATSFEQMYCVEYPAYKKQILKDRSGHGNHAQLGSTTGADTNDPQWTGNGLLYGADDFCRTPITIPQAATIITVVNPPNLSVARGFFGNRGGTNYRSYIYCNSGSGVLYYGVASSYDITLGFNLTAGETACLMMRYGDGHIQGFKGATKGDSKTYVNTWGTPAQWDIGNASNSYYNGGNILFTASYDRTLSDVEYLHAYNYLKRLMAQRGVTI